MPNEPSHAALPAAIDLDHLRRQTLDDRALAAELLMLFARQARRILGDLAALSDGDAPRHRADLLHALCGSARAVGAWEVAQHAATFERQERVAALTTGGGVELPQLERSVARACEAIDRLLAALPDVHEPLRPSATRR